MADSQNTYQNDVKIKSGNNIIKIIGGVLAAAVIGFGGYYICDNEIEKAYSSGYSTGYDEGYNEGNEDGYTEGYNKGESSGYNKGYDTGYRNGKLEIPKNSSSTSSSSNNKSSSSGSSKSNPKTYNYILNKNTDKFHYSWCPSVYQMKEKNKVYFTGTRQEVINKGYSPCKNCNP